MWRGKTLHGRSDHAFEVVESVVVDSAHRQFLATDRHGPQTGSPDHQDEAPRRNPLADSGSKPGVNGNPISKEPAARTAQHRARARSRVGWTIPAPYAKCNSNSHRIPHPDVDAPRLVTREASQNAEKSLSRASERCPTPAEALARNHMVSSDRLAAPILTTNHACKACGVRELYGFCNLCRVWVLLISE